jgi:hypothetical protein
MSLNPLKLFFKYSGIHRDSNSQNGSPLGSVKVHSLTLSYLLGSMRSDSRASLLSHTFASPCLGYEPKARVTTLHDSNNLISSSLFQIPTNSSQGHQWVDGFGHYHIVNDSLNHNSWDTIFMPKTTSFLVKIVKEEHKIPNTLPQCSYVLAFFFFIELFDFSLDDDLTFFPFSLKSLIVIFQSIAP